MNRKFTQEYRVEFADCDSKYDLKPQTLLAWASELAGNHLRSRNITREKMWEDGQVFLLTKAAIHYLKVPVYNSLLNFTTWEGGTKGSQFIRRFELREKDGELLCDLETMWVLVNPQTHKLYRPKEYIYELIPDESTTTAKIEKLGSDNLKPAGEYTFVYSDIDANKHVNNGTYLRIASDILSSEITDKHFKSIMINFIHECRQGETIKLFKEECEDYAIVTGCVGEDKNNFEIRFTF